MKLLKFQQEYLHSALEPVENPDMSAIRDLINEDGISAERRLAIYRNNTIASLRDGLMHTYRSVHKALGAEVFANVVQKFICAHPPKMSHLYAYGSELPAFLASHPVTAEVTWLPDLALYDWHFNLCAHTNRKDPISMEALMAIPEQQHAEIIFEVQPALVLHHSDYEVDTLYTDDVDEEAEQKPITLTKLREPRNYMTYQAPEEDKIQIYTKILSPAENTFIRSIKAGQPLGAAVESALEIDSDFDIVKSLHKHFTVGNFVGTRFN